MKKRIKYNLIENIFISFIITFTAGTIWYEESLPESFMSVYKPLLFAVSICAWLYIAFFSGVRNKWSYEIYTMIFWLVPQLIIYLANDGPEIFRMSITMYLLSEFFTIMFNTPAEYVGGFFHIGVFPFLFIIALICTFAFLAGNLFSDKFKDGNYTF